MHLAFIDIATAYHAAAPYEGPLGGTQAAVCYLSAELAKRGARVTLINQRREAGETLGVKNLPPEALDDDAALKPFTHLVFNGRWTEKLLRSLRGFTPAPFIGWMHEACFQSPYIMPSPAFNAFVFVSRWQKNLNAPLIPPSARSTVIANGIAPGFHGLFAGGTVLSAKAAPPIAAYAGSSKRGLLHLPEIIPLLHQAHPALRFEIYSDGVVGLSEEENRAFREKLGALPAVTHLGAVDQNTLAQRLARTSYLISPNAYPETFCIVLAEALAAGLRVIATTRAALPETAGGFAALMPFDHPDDPNWIPQDLSPARFAAFAAQEIARWETLPPAEKETALHNQISFARTRYTWADHAAGWMDFLKT